jgi:hypothetical protein
LFDISQIKNVVFFIKEVCKHFLDWQLPGSIFDSGWGRWIRNEMLSGGESSPLPLTIKKKLANNWCHFCRFVIFYCDLFNLRLSIIGWKWMSESKSARCSNWCYCKVVFLLLEKQVILVSIDVSHVSKDVCSYLFFINSQKLKPSFGGMWYLLIARLIGLDSCSVPWKLGLATSDECYYILHFKHLWTLKS